ncbi:HEAT repeat domain-containing protein [Kitasatospora sp. NPDC006697]|uniref:HEAT repeat domain-containing protein n=1 Tax=Kitasatospora sp. NPDC006697 TaxID=3364020 RepID=UPI00368F69AF
MHLPALLAAIESGDENSVLDLLDSVRSDEFTGEQATTLLSAAAHAGLDEAVRQLIDGGADPTRPWADGSDPVSWATERGDYTVLLALLSRSHDQHRPDSPQRRALRAAEAALGAATPGEPGPPPAHLAIVSHLEAALGIHRTPDELLARALVHALPQHDDWFESVSQLSYRTTWETFEWISVLVSDTCSVARRRFGLDVLRFMTFGLPSPHGPSAADDYLTDELPFARQATDLLCLLLDTEQDPYALRSAIAAFGSYCASDEIRAVLGHARHPDPGIRREVAGLIATNRSTTVTADDPEILAAMIRLTGDQASEVRAAALSALTASTTDTPALREALTARLGDPHFDARLHAASALVLRGDERGRPVLDEIRRGISSHRSPGALALDALDYRLRSHATRR